MGADMIIKTLAQSVREANVYLENEASVVMGNMPALFHHYKVPALYEQNFVYGFALLLRWSLDQFQGPLMFEGKISEEGSLSLTISRVRSFATDYLRDNEKETSLQVITSQMAYNLNGEPFERGFFSNQKRVAVMYVNPSVSSDMMEERICFKCQSFLLFKRARHFFEEMGGNMVYLADGIDLLFSIDAFEILPSFFNEVEKS